MQKQSMRLVFSLPLLFLFVSGSASAEWYKDYDAGLKHIKKREWSAAISTFQAAISDKADEAVNIKFYGTRFDDYLPHYYLGMAYFYQNNFQAALSEFQKSENYGAIRQKDDLNKKMMSLRTIARAQLAVNATSKDTQAAQQQIKTIVTPPEKETPRQTNIQPKQEPVAEAKKKQPVVKPPVASPPPEEKKVVELPQETGSIKPAVQTPTVEIAAFKKMMKTAAQNYFEGNYDSAIKSLLSAINIDPDIASAHFLLGCAYASKYLLSGSQDEDLLKNASAAFKKSKSIDPDYHLINSSYISPAVMQIYEKTS